jgi:hypothetical protein
MALRMELLVEDTGEVVDDQSAHWFPSLRRTDAFHVGSIKQALASRIADALHAAYDAGACGVRDLIAPLAAYRYAVFRRITIGLILHAGADDEAASQLLQKGNYVSLSPSPEFAELLNGRFACLSSDQQRSIEEVIRQKADTANLGNDFSPDEVVVVNERRTLNYLSLIADDLSSDARVELQRLVAKYGPSSAIVSPLPSRAYSVGPYTPWTFEQFKTMTPSEMALALRRWEPPPAEVAMMPRYLGPAEHLRDAVAESPEAFVAAPAEFSEMKPVYISHLASGFQQALCAHKTFNWRPLIEYMHDIAQESGGDEDDGDQAADVTLSQVRSRFCLLLIDGMHGHYHTIPFESGELILDILERAASDTDPPSTASRVRYESALSRSHRDTRAVAIRAVLVYANWTQESDTATRELVDRDAVRKNARVQAILDAHISDPSASVLSVFGEKFDWLCRLDYVWASSIVRALFSTAEDASSAAFAAWEAFVSSSAPKTYTYDLLSAQYRFAVRTWTLVEETQSNANGQYANRMCDHVLTLYWHGVTSLDELIPSWYARISDKAAAHGMHFIGRSLHEGVEPAVEARLKGFWEWRLAQIGGNVEEHRGELESFGSWFCSARLDERWALSELNAMLRLTCGRVEPAHRIADCLAAVSDAGVVAALDCVEQMIIGADASRHYFWSDAWRRLFKRGLALGSPTAERVREIVGRLVARRISVFDDLVN